MNWVTSRVTKMVVIRVGMIALTMIMAVVKMMTFRRMMMNRRRRW